ncbi:HAD-IIIA family hydrolase [Mycobacterium yunnanensis]|uniref:D,D-heptose 1,7-bisphosphate phosphatase n=1 Tax=Mycobacterium yunnanensis TaxID=368477 RepID=A0A9X3C311_9MYCO|nr:HAD-IIIA family hydrolase [Mycobacterium yunnanensis]MCV7421267.1 HAD-IIIA family hydrolase [Mycobacterium yunnanensis]
MVTARGDGALDCTIVIPTIGRDSLSLVLDALCASAARPAGVVIVDDRPGGPTELELRSRLPVTLVRSGGRGPAGARNVGWRVAHTRWIGFLDDDVLPEPGWLDDLAVDLAAAEAACAAGSQGVLEVPAAVGRRATDDERRTLRLATARWITADMAYRRDSLVAVGGFDERFPRAYREDSDLALRLLATGRHVVSGRRRAVHPVAPSTPLSSVRAQFGNRDDALMRRKFGPGWRREIGEGPGRLPAHATTTVAVLVAALSAVAGRRPGASGATGGGLRTARAAAAVWLAMTAEFAARRFAAGPRQLAEAATVIVTSALIPPVAVWHRLVGEWRHRRAVAHPVLAVLLDRDDTIIEDGPFLADPDGVRPLPGAVRALARLRAEGLRLAIVTNQSGVARGLISADQLDAVNTKVDDVLGPFDSWQVCVHDDATGCGCRKPRPGMVLAAADALGVPPERCVMIGDTGGDVDAALAANARAVLVPTERTRSGEIASARLRANVAATLSDAVAMVLREAR